MLLDDEDPMDFLDSAATSQEERVAGVSQLLLTSVSTQCVQNDLHAL